MPKRRKQLKRRRSDRRASPGDVQRYPRRSTIIDAILPTMMDKLSIDMVRVTNPTRTVHLWGLACSDTDTTIDVTYTAVDLDSDPVKSPILDAAAGLVGRFPGRRLWGFGLASQVVGELFAGPDGIPDDALRDIAEGRLQERPTADEMCTVSVFDARGRSYNAAMYIHMPELGVASWQHNTLADAASVDEWVRRFYGGVVSAQVWAAALTQDFTRNHAVVRRLRLNNTGAGRGTL